MRMSIQVAVTGANGHVGNVVCRELLAQGYRVKAFYQNDATSLTGLDLELIQGSVLNKNDVLQLVESCDVVIHCAAIISINGDPSGMVFKTNTEGSKNVWEVCVAKAVKRMIHVSSVHAVTELPHSEAYDENRPYKTAVDYVYDYSKAFAEQWLFEAAKNSSVELVVVRPSCVMGPSDFKPSKMGSALIDFYHQKVPLLPKGGYDLIDVRDVAHSIIRTIEFGENGEVYLLSGNYYSLKAMTQVIQQVTGKKMPQKTLPFWFLKCCVPFATMASRITKKSNSLTKESIDALKHGHPCMNNAKATSELNHRCRPLEETLHDFYEWQREKKVII